MPTTPNIEEFDMKKLFFSERILKNVNNDDLSCYQKSLLSSLIRYNDLYYPEATYDKWEETAHVYSLHAINHILKSRAVVLQNNAKLQDLNPDTDNIDWDLFKDQGFSCGKVLILLPSKHAAHRLVDANKSHLFQLYIFSIFKLLIQAYFSHIFLIYIW